MQLWSVHPQSVSTRVLVVRPSQPTRAIQCDANGRSAPTHSGIADGIADPAMPDSAHYTDSAHTLVIRTAAPFLADAAEQIDARDLGTSR